MFKGDFPGKPKYVLGIMPAKKGRKSFRISDRRKALKKAKYMCQGGRCKQPKLVRSKHKRFGYVVEFDHWNNRAWDNRPKNIKVLCPTCHSGLTVTSTRKRYGAFGQVYHESIKRSKAWLIGRKRKSVRKPNRKTSRTKQIGLFDLPGFKPPKSGWL